MTAGFRWLTLVLGVALLPTVVGTHNQGCVPSRAEPGTYWLIDTPDGRRFYLEERSNSDGSWWGDLNPPTSPPPPLWGFFFGGGTWLYEETNGLDAPEGSMQRGTLNLVGGCFPPPPLPCLIIDEDPINDYSCGHGPDSIIF